MDEEIAIINKNTRNEKIKNFFVNNKRILISLVFVFLAILISYFVYIDYTKDKKIEISENYNSLIIEYSSDNKTSIKNSLIKIIKQEDPTYSPLSLYFIIDNELTTDKALVNELFDIVIKNNSLEKEIKNLIIYKKALYNADHIRENELLDILSPIINSESIWKSHALYLVAEYFYSKNEKQKSKEFYNKIINLETTNQDLRIKVQKRLNRDLSE